MGKNEKEKGNREERENMTERAQRGKGKYERGKQSDSKERRKII